MTIRLLIVDDHLVFREIATRVLSQEPDIEIAGSVGTVQEALLLLERGTADVVLLDYDLHGRSGAEFISEARSRGFAGRILIVTAGMPENELRSALHSGVSGIVLKEESLARLLAAIRAVAEGRLWLDSVRLKTLVTPEPDIADLAVRERMILVGLINGLTNKELSVQLGIPETSVKSGIQILFRKIGVRTRASLVRVAMERYRPLVARTRAAKQLA